MSFFETSLKYNKIWLATFFHGFPHFDLSFERTNSSFNPENENYVEALEFWIGIPLIFCLLLWLAFIIFFCLRYHSKSQHKESSRGCVCFFGGLFWLFGCGAVSVDLYENSEVRDGLDTFVHAVKSINRTITSSLQVLNALDDIGSKVDNQDLPSLNNAVSGITNLTVHKLILDFIHQIEDNINYAIKDLQSIRDDAVDLNTQELTDKTEEVEYYRWVVTVVVCCITIVIFLFTLIGFVKKSRRMLTIVSVMSIFYWVVIWAMTAVYLALSVAGGDLCVDPNQFVLSRVSGTVQQNILMAYIDCTDKSQPYQGQIIDAQTLVAKAVLTLTSAVNMLQPFNISDKISGPVQVLREDFIDASGNLSSLTSLVGSCDTIHDDYIRSLRGVCNTALFGVGFMVLFSAVLGMCGAAVVLTSAIAWPSFCKSGRHQNHGYICVDDTDPFLPNAPSYEHNYGSFRQSALYNTNDLENNAENISVGRGSRQNFKDESPPPAYYSGHFIQQYSNLAPRPNSITQSLAVERTSLQPVLKKGFCVL